MKTKSFFRYYLLTALILTGIAAVPAWNFLIMAHGISRGYPWRDYHYEVIVVIPFAAVTAAILLGFLLLPLLRNMLSLKRHVSVSVAAVLFFCGLEYWAELIAARADALRVVMLSRRMFMPDEIAAITREAMLIPTAVKIHYYIFSIVLILAVLNWLYNLSEALYESGRKRKKLLITQGVATACYAPAYFLVRVMQYDDYAAMRLTWGSILNAVVCFTLAATAVGLFSVSYLRFEGKMKIVPSLLSVITVLALYGAEYAMLDRKFYSYGENSIASLILHILIAAIPGLLVYLLLRFIPETE